MPGGTRFRWVKVPLNPRPRVDIQDAGVIPCGPKHFGGQGVYREVESEGLEENHRVVIEGSHPNDEPVGQR